MSEETREELARARAELLRAEASLAAAETRKAAAEASTAESEARAAEIALDREELKRRDELAADEFHRVYRFSGAVASDSVKNCVATLSRWHRVDPNCFITLVFHSPGGEVVAGFALWDFLMELKETHHLTTVARGYAASMAGILLQAGHVRVMGAEASLLIHEGSFGAIGTVGSVEDTVEWVRKLQDRILDIFAARSKMSRAQLKRRWHRKDWWLTSDEALKYGFVDEVGGGGVV